MFAVRGHDTEAKADQLRKLAKLPNRSAAVRYALEFALRSHLASGESRDLSGVAGRFKHLRRAGTTRKAREELYQGMDV